MESKSFHFCNKHLEQNSFEYVIKLNENSTAIIDTDTIHCVIIHETATIPGTTKYIWGEIARNDQSHEDIDGH